MLASGADRALQLGLRILAARAPGRRGAPAPAAAAAGPPGAGLAIAHRLKQDVDQVRRRRGRHAAGQRRDRALQLGLLILAARAPDRRGAPAPARPARCWPSADRALQPVLQILATCAPGQRGAPAACCSWITRYCTAFGWNAVAVLLESNKAKDQRTDQQMQSKGSSTSPRGFERSEPGQDMRR